MAGETTTQDAAAAGAWGANGVWAYDSSSEDDEETTLSNPGADGTSATTGVLHRQLPELQALFASMDRMGEGRINRLDFRNALENNPRVRAFLGFPLHFEPGSVWHAAFEAVFQCFDSAENGGITWPEFQAQHKEARALIKSKRPKLSVEEIRIKVSAVYTKLDPSGAGMVTRLDLERDLMEIAFLIPAVHGLDALVRSRDEMVVDIGDWKEDFESWMVGVKGRKEQEDASIKSAPAAKSSRGLTPEQIQKNEIVKDLAHRLKKLVHCAATLFNVMEPGATDGRVIFSGFKKGVAWIQLRPLPSDRHLRMLFDSYDVGGDGSLNFQAQLFVRPELLRALEMHLDADGNEIRGWAQDTKRAAWGKRVQPGSPPPSEEALKRGLVKAKRGSVIESPADLMMALTKKDHSRLWANMNPSPADTVTFEGFRAGVTASGIRPVPGEAIQRAAFESKEFGLDKAGKLAYSKFVKAMTKKKQKGPTQIPSPKFGWSAINTSGGDNHHEYADFDQQWRKKLHGFNIR